MGKKTGSRTSDRTGQIQAAQAAEDGHGFFRALIENSLDAVVVVGRGYHGTGRGTRPARGWIVAQC